MKILLISTLYPAFPNESRRVVTRALHNIVRIWARTHRVMVLIPVVHPRRAKTNLLNMEGVTLSPIKYFKIAIHSYKWPITIRAISRVFMGFYSLLFAIYTVVVFGRPDLVIGHSGFCIELALSLSILFRRRLVVGLHATDTHRISAGAMFVYRKAFDIASLIACRSRGVRDELRVHSGLKYEKKCTLALSGIDIKKIWPLQRYYDKARAEKSVFRFCTVASLKKLKNIDVNLKALAKLNTNWEYDIVGDGEERPRLESLCKELGILSRTRFHGFCDPDYVERIISDSDAMLMISKPETLGLAFFEAMAKGCVVFGARGCGVDGIVTDRKDGYLLEAEDVDALLNALIEFTSMDVKNRLEMANEIHSKIYQYNEELLAIDYLDKATRGMP